MERTALQQISSHPALADPGGPGHGEQSHRWIGQQLIQLSEFIGSKFACISQRSCPLVSRITGALAQSSTADCAMTILKPAGLAP
ncbi:hypothetical protein ACFO5K_18280 [Nocardia halotolerans]|uniref:Uncharacterized protein n=1 Tax=Nocardia halotolerans TaxID=1755878 RepID=A0ABV8VNB7_9NOCA